MRAASHVEASEQSPHAACDRVCLGAEHGAAGRSIWLRSPASAGAHPWAAPLTPPTLGDVLAMPTGAHAGAG